KLKRLAPSFARLWRKFSRSIYSLLNAAKVNNFSPDSYLIPEMCRVYYPIYDICFWSRFYISTIIDEGVINNSKGFTMPAKRWLLIATVLALQILVIHGWAQGDELSQQVELSDNFVLFIPDAWEAEYEEELGGFFIRGDTAGVLVFEPSQAAEVFDFKENDPLIDILIETYRQFAGSRVRRTDVEEITLGAFS